MGMDQRLPYPHLIFEGQCELADIISANSTCQKPLDRAHFSHRDLCRKTFVNEINGPVSSLYINTCAQFINYISNFQTCIHGWLSFLSAHQPIEELSLEKCGKLPPVQDEASRYTGEISPELIPSGLDLSLTVTFITSKIKILLSGNAHYFFDYDLFGFMLY